MHPEIVVVIRYRAGNYAEAARNAAPQAIQVADRWHLLKNLRDALVLVYERHRRLLSELNAESTLVAPPGTQRQEELVLLNQLAPAPPPTPRPLSRTRLIDQVRLDHCHYWKAQLERVQQMPPVTYDSPPRRLAALVLSRPETLSVTAPDYPSRAASPRDCPSHPPGLSLC